ELPAYANPRIADPSSEQSLPPGTTVTAPRTADSTPSSPKLPSEAELPSPTAGLAVTQVDQRQSADGQPAGAPDAAGDADPLGLAASMDNRPWLRLVSTTPVDMVRSLAFTPDGQRLTIAGDDKAVVVYSR